METDRHHANADGGGPPVLLHGSPREADRFLVAALWSQSGGCVPLPDVMKWAAVLRGRGEAFASHVAACSYWLYEHAADFPELLRAWEMEQRAGTAARRSVVALERQRALVGHLAQIGADASRAKMVLGSMEQTCRVFSEVWEMRMAALDRLTRSSLSANRPAQTTTLTLTGANPAVRTDVSSCTNDTACRSAPSHSTRAH